MFLDGTQSGRSYVTGEIVAKCRRRRMMTKDCHGFLATIKRDSKPFGELPSRRGEINQSGLESVSNRIERRKALITEIHILRNGKFASQRDPSGRQALDPVAKQHIRADMPPNICSSRRQARHADLFDHLFMCLQLEGKQPKRVFAFSKALKDVVALRFWRQFRWRANWLGNERSPLVNQLPCFAQKS